jgi:hypothetical protein
MFFFMLVASPAEALADKLTEANMTQRDYNNITAQESSVQGQPPAVPPTPVHNLTPADEQAITAAGGTKLISGKDWKHESPQERDAHLRRMDSTLPDGSTYIISVPKGDVWLIPASESQDGFGASQKLQDLEARNIVRPWTDAEREALPKAVARDKAVSQSDKHGTTREKPVKKEKKP